MHHLTWNNGTAQNLSLEDIQTEEQVLSTDVTSYGNPLQNSSSTYNVDGEGNIRTITITGTKTDTQANLQAWVLAIEGMINCATSGSCERRSVSIEGCGHLRLRRGRFRLARQDALCHDPEVRLVQVRSDSGPDILHAYDDREALPMSSVVGTVAVGALGSNGGNKTFCGLGLRWVFYFSSGTIQYTTAPDAATWAPLTNTTYAGEDFALYWDGSTYVYLAVCNGTTISFYKGTVSVSGTIAFVLMNSLTSTYTSLYDCSLNVDLNGYLQFCVCAYTSPNYVVQGSTCSNGTTFGALATIFGTSTLRYYGPRVLGLQTPNLVCIAATTAHIYAIFYNGTTWSGQLTVDSVISFSGVPLAWDAVALKTGKVWIAFSTTSAVEINWIYASTCVAGNEIANGFSACTKLHICQDPNSDDLYFLGNFSNAWYWQTLTNGNLGTGGAISGEGYLSAGSNFQSLIWLGQNRNVEGCYVTGTTLRYLEISFLPAIFDIEINNLYLGDSGGNYNDISSYIMSLDFTHSANGINDTLTFTVPLAIWNSILGLNNPVTIELDLDMNVATGQVWSYYFGFIGKISPQGNIVEVTVTEEMVYLGDENVTQQWTGANDVYATVILSDVYNGSTGQFITGGDPAYSATGISAVNSKAMTMYKLLPKLGSTADSDNPLAFFYQYPTVSSGHLVASPTGHNGTHAFRSFSSVLQTYTQKVLTTDLNFLAAPVWANPLDYIINDVTIIYAGGTYHTNNSTSIAKYGSHSQNYAAPFITSLTDATRLANMIMGAYSAPHNMLTATTHLGDLFWEIRILGPGKQRA